MNKLDEIRKKLQSQDRTTKSAQGVTDNTVYPHWNLPTDGRSVLRFLPDADPDNVFFWVEKQVIKIPFPGIKGHEEDRKTIVQVPCMEMYGDQCPILNEIRPWFNTERDQEARTYWKKRSYIFQGFVVEDGIGEEEVPENPIRRFSMTTQIFQIIKTALLDPDMEEIPTDYTNGTNFKVAKGQKGEWADYTMSSWMRKESPLEQAQLDAIDKYGLNDLSTFLPTKPDAASQDVIFDMFEASVRGDLYDPERWASYYKPFGLNVDTSNSENSNTPSVASAPKASADSQLAQKSQAENTKESEPEAPVSPNAILDRLRQRSNS